MVIKQRLVDDIFKDYFIFKASCPFSHIVFWVPNSQILENSFFHLNTHIMITILTEILDRCGKASLIYILVAGGFVRGEGQPQFFVSPDGSGAEFSSVKPGELIDARDAIRVINQNMTEDIIVMLKGGIYDLRDGLRLWERDGVSDSGSNGFNIVYRAVPGETPIFSGGLTVTGWELFDSQKNIYRAFVGNDVKSRQLFVNGKKAIRARSPLNPSGFELNSDGTGFVHSLPEMGQWGNQANIELVQRFAWRLFRVPVSEITPNEIIMQEPAWTLANSGKTSIKMNGVSWIENAFELLLSPGMWYLDPDDSYLYYIPLVGENLFEASVILPVGEMLVDASGSASHGAIENIIFEGITFADTTWLEPSGSEGYTPIVSSILWRGPTVDSAYKTMAAVSFQKARNIQVRHCKFQNLGGVALDFGKGCQWNTCVGSTFEDIASGAITLGVSTDQAVSDQTEMTDNNVFENNYIRRIGQEYEDAAAIWVGYARNTTISHNEIDNVPWSGVSIGWGWGAQSYATNNVVSGNFVGKIGQILQDCGSIYTLGPQPGSRQVRNYLRDSCDNGFYWDEGTSYHSAVDNVVDNTAIAWLKIHPSGGAENNVFNFASGNYSNTAAMDIGNNSNTVVVEGNVAVTRKLWPPKARRIILDAGLEERYEGIKPREIFVNDTDLGFDRVPLDWTYSDARYVGNYHNDVHFTENNDEELVYRFQASEIHWLSEFGPDLGEVDVFLDGKFYVTVNCFSSCNVSQARAFSVGNLSDGVHEIRLKKKSGQRLVLDGFVVVPQKYWGTLEPQVLEVVPGGAMSSVLKLEEFPATAEPIELKIADLPDGWDAYFDTPIVTERGFSILTIRTSTATKPGRYVMAVGARGAANHLAVVTVIVAAPESLPDLDDDGMSDEWTIRYFGHAESREDDQSFPISDPDGDGQTNLEEFFAGTDPLSSLSTFELGSIRLVESGRQLTWTVVGGQNYVLQAAPILGAVDQFVDISPIISVPIDHFGKHPGLGMSEIAQTSFVDSREASESQRRFYRVRTER